APLLGRTSNASGQRADTQVCPATRRSSLGFFSAPRKKPRRVTLGLWDRCLTMSYSHMGRPHTTIGAERFHVRVRDGIGWFTLAIVIRQNGLAEDQLLGS